MLLKYYGPNGIILFETTVLSNIKVITLETIALAFPVNGMYHCVNAELENHPIQAIGAVAYKSIDRNSSIDELII